MKIVHLVQYLMQGHTYQENYLPHAMARLGHEVTVIAGVDNPDFYTDPPHAAGDTVIDKELVKVRYVKMHYASLWTRIDGLYGILEQENPDIVYVHGFLLTRCFALRRYMLRHPACRFVADTHETYALAFNGCFTDSPKDRIRHFVYFHCVYRWWARMVERHYEKLFYVSPPRKEYAMEAFGFSESFLEPLWLGADLQTLPYPNKAALRGEIRQKLGLAADARILLLAGKLDRLKHPVELAEAFAELDADGWYLVFVGSMPDDIQAQIDRIAKANGRILLTGFVSGDEVLAYITACDLAVYPGAPSVLWQQTVCSGIPAVFYEPKAGYAQYLSDDSARFVTTGSKEEILACIRPLTASDALRQQMGQRARRHGERILSYDALAEKAIRIASRGAAGTDKTPD